MSRVYSIFGVLVAVGLGFLQGLTVKTQSHRVFGLGLGCCGALGFGGLPHACSSWAYPCLDSLRRSRSCFEPAGPPTTSSKRPRGGYLALRYGTPYKTLLEIEHILDERSQNTMVLKPIIPNPNISTPESASASIGEQDWGL